jgi:hypothetical protein
MTKSIPLGRTLLVAFLVATGIAATWFTVVIWSEMVLQSATLRSRYSEQICFTLDGEPLIVRSSFDPSFPERTTTLTGQLKQVSASDLLYPHYLTAPSRQQWPTPVDWGSRLAAANDGGAPATYWYLVHDGRSPGHAYGVGYHAQTKALVGYFAKSGFTRTKPQRDDWFEIAGDAGLSGVSTAYGASEPRYYYSAESRVFLLASGKLWSIDMAQKQVRPLLDCPGAHTVGEFWQLPAIVPQLPEGKPRPAAQSITPQRAVVRRPEDLIVVDQSGGRHVTYPLPASTRDAMLAGAMLPDGKLVLLVWRPNRGQWQEALWLEPGGQVIQSQPVPLERGGQTFDLAPIAWMFSAAAPFPLAGGLMAAFAPLALVEGDQADSYWSGLAKGLAELWPMLLVLLAVGAVTARAAYRRQKRLGLPHAVAWAIFAYVLGIPGWLAYRLHRTWPVLEDCPACGQAAPRDRASCTECGAAFPPPPLKGIEVFA